MISEQQRQAFQTLAQELEGIDTAIYAECGKDPLEPIIGLGNPKVRVGFFGRDPGRDEILRGMPFIGAGGQKVRNTCYEYLYSKPMPDFEASVAVGKHFFWANTVPYKPLGNKAWSMRVKKQFQPLVAELLVNWRGSDVITLGREAFLWFGIHQSRETRQALESFWAREDRFSACIEVPLVLADGHRRTLRLHPLPHPSPLNATWYRRFPGLLKARLQQLNLHLDNVRLAEAATATE
ncbi:uracil-DNA glycosylase family protein [Thiohalomonas denitrificans]|uniref:uracil-DNA glycosylase family protein n=1 Tax=Thiohalomonas denitrificans TaxID=415747 RepID=UPI0026ECD4E7|nr:uracil-DNA glycosylase family protein [Thiohalomonas denitrificans]